LVVEAVRLAGLVLSTHITNLIHDLTDSEELNPYAWHSNSPSHLHFLDHGHSGEGLIHFIDSDHVLLIELGRLLAWALLDIELLLEVLLKVAPELRWAHLVHFLRCFGQSFSIRRNLVLVPNLRDQRL